MPHTPLNGGVAPVPLPAAAWPGMITLLLVGIGLHMRRRAVAR